MLLLAFWRLSGAKAPGVLRMSGVPLPGLLPDMQRGWVASKWFL